MPSRNIIRMDAPDSYYHVYSRGISRSEIFRSSDDKDYFLYLFSRHLSKKPTKTKAGYTYPHYRKAVELLTYCLMGNHFHLLFYQKEHGQVAQCMKSVLTGYVAYFNNKYGRSGPLFESKYKASRIDSEPYLLHVSRYIHLNPRYWKYYPHSSLTHIRKGTEPEWLQTDKVLRMHKDRVSYLEFVADYEANTAIITELKHQLANST